CVGINAVETSAPAALGRSLEVRSALNRAATATHPEIQKYSPSSGASPVMRVKTCSRRSGEATSTTSRVGMETTMWTRDKSFMFRRPRTWHLAPPIDREAATHPSYGIGNISSLTWEEKFGPGPVNEAKVEATPPKPQIDSRRN